RATIRQIGYLDRSRFTGKDQEAAVRQVHREINQDVDSITADGTGKLVIGEAGDLAPNIDPGAASFGYCVPPARGVVTEDLERSVVMSLQERQHEATYRVRAEVGRDITDPKPARWRSVVRMRQERARQGSGERRVPTAMLGEDRSGIVVRM